jgi:hypothetical protein
VCAYIVVGRHLHIPCVENKEGFTKVIELCVQPVHHHLVKGCDAYVSDLIEIRVVLISLLLNTSKVVIIWHTWYLAS